MRARRIFLHSSHFLLRGLRVSVVHLLFPLLRVSAPPRANLFSKRFRQVENMRCDVRQDHVGRDRSHLIEPRLAEFAFDVEILGEAETAMSPGCTCPRHTTPLQRPAAWPCSPRRHRACRRRTGRPPSSPSRRLPQPVHGRAQWETARPGSRRWPARTPERVARDIGACTVDEEASVTDPFGRDQDALRIHAVDDIAEAFSLPRRCGFPPALRDRRRTAPSSHD